MSSINNTENALFAADISESLEWEAKGRPADNSSVESGAHIEAVGSCLSDGLAESPFQFILVNGKFDRNLARFQRGVLLQRSDTVFESSIKTIEVDQRVILLEVEVIECDGDSSRGVLHKHTFICRRIDYLRSLCL